MYIKKESKSIINNGDSDENYIMSKKIQFYENIIEDMVENMRILYHNVIESYIENFNQSQILDRQYNKGSKDFIAFMLKHNSCYKKAQTELQKLRGK